LEEERVSTSLRIRTKPVQLGRRAREKSAAELFDVALERVLRVFLHFGIGVLELLERADEVRLVSWSTW